MTPQDDLRTIQRGLAKGEALEGIEARNVCAALHTFSQAWMTSKDPVSEFGLGRDEWAKIWAERPRIRILDAKARARAVYPSGEARMILKHFGLTLADIGKGDT